MPRATARPLMLPQLQARLAGSLARQRQAASRAFRALAAQQRQENQAVAAEQQREALSVVAATPTATQLLAHFFACELHPSDCYLLYGSVGAGKSYFSRAFIRAAAADEDLPVPSPTFLLQNIYTEHQGPPIHHFDLYRLTEQYDLARLDLRTSFTQAVCLVEWPERLGSQQRPADHLAVHISIIEPAEQERLQQQLRQGRRRQHEARSSGSSSSSPAAAAGGGVAEEEEGSSSSEEDEDGSGDTRWRRVLLSPAGQRWQPRMQLLREYLDAEGAQLGCYLEGTAA